MGWRWLEHPAAPALVYLLLLLTVLGPVIFSPETRILSMAGTDLWGQFMSWREFGFFELKKGNLPMWNPHVYCGMPYFAGFQSALLYPPNWLHLVLPLPAAVNGGIFFHLWMGGMSTYVWLRWGRGLHPLAALMGGGLYIFCGPHYLHVAAGHLTNLCVMAWIPLVFWLLDRWNQGGGRKVLVAGAGIVALQILAGHPQYVFFTAVMAGIYNLLLSPWSLAGKGRALAGQAGFYVGGALLAAVQLLPGLLANEEGARSGGMTFEQARIFSFPLENLLTLFVPSFFGGLGDPTYSGRWLYWEMVLFVTVTALFLVIWGVKERGRRLLPATVFFATALILALGYYTPLYGWLHAHVPGFNLFRGQSKFILFAALALIWLAAEGLDALWGREQQQLPSRLEKPWVAVFVLAGLIMGAAAWTFHGEGGVREMTTIIGAIRDTREVLAPALSSRDQVGLLAAGASHAWAGSAIIWMGCLAGVWFLRERCRMLALLLVVAGLGEALLFASRQTPSFSMTEFDQSFPLEYFREKSPDDRIFFEMGNNISMYHHRNDIWGSDPALPKRYAAYITATQGYAAKDAGQTIVFRKIHSSYPMLRLKYVCFLDRETMKLGVSVMENVLPVASLFQRYQVVENPGVALGTVATEGWDFQNQVLLEEPPQFVAGSGNTAEKETVQVRRVDSDTLRISVDCVTDGILLVTESYSRGWRAKSLEGSQIYPVLPANTIFMGIPLAKGRHEIVLEYVQRGLRAGAAISMLSLVAAVWMAWGKIPGRRSKA